MTEINYHEILGVSKEASLAEVKSAYRRLALKYHPDTSRRKSARRRFVEITTAYKVLSDPLKREAYERGGTNVVCDDPCGFLDRCWKRMGKNGCGETWR